MMKDVVLTIQENRPLTPAVRRMELKGDVRAVTAPGQFINLLLEGFFLRRPLSVYDKSGDTVAVVYKVVGRGTEALARMRAGETLRALTGLGNGYDLAPAGARPLLLGGGAGVPPLYWLAKELIAAGRRVTAVLGFNTAEEVFAEREFRALGCAVTVTTVDGSYGRTGFVTDALPRDYTYFYTCGPEPMLRAVYRACATGGQFSFEERMGCGFGACMGCSCKTVTGFKRICKEGPVLKKEELLWT